MPRRLDTQYRYNVLLLPLQWCTAFPRNGRSWVSYDPWSSPGFCPQPSREWFYLQFVFSLTLLSFKAFRPGHIHIRKYGSDCELQHMVRSSDNDTRGPIGILLEWWKHGSFSPVVFNLLLNQKWFIMMLRFTVFFSKLGRTTAATAAG